MSVISNVVSIGSALTMVDYLIAAYGVTQDPISKALIKAALIHEGRKLAATVPIEAFLEEEQPG